MYDWQLLNIDTLKNGAAKDKMNFAIQEAVENALDLNRDYKKPRKAILEVTLLPSEDRSGIEVLFQAKTKLVPDKPGADHVVIKDTEDGGVAYVNNAEQLDIADQIAVGAVQNMSQTGDNEK